MELAICGAFIVLQISAKCLPIVCKLMYAKAGHWAFVQRVSANHWVVWLFHPALWHGLHDYAIHLVVYSGYIINAH